MSQRTSSIPPATTLSLYEQLAQKVKSLIDCGTLRPGARLPSVRKFSQQQDVSISTVLQAYSVLENEGWIEARPQSGYYVKFRHWKAPEEPGISKPQASATDVTVGRLVMQVLQAIRDPSLVGFGAALPSPELLPTKALNQAMTSIGRRHPEAGNSYDVPPGHPALRIQIARRALESGCSLSPSEIVTTCGGLEALNLCLRAVANPGDTIAIESPTYFGILQCIETLGMKALEIPTHPRDGVSLEALEYALEHQNIKACLFVLNYNNPLGSCMPDENKKRLVELLANHQVPLIEDDIYGDLSFDQERPRTAKSYDEKGLVLLCDSFSKTLAPGYRVGWTAPGRFQEKVEYYKMVTTMATATLPQMAIADFLANGFYNRHLRKVRKVYQDQVARVTEAVTRYFPEGTKATRPSGGHVLWVELPEEMDSLAIFERALAEKISICPGPIFSAKRRFRNCIRLSCGHPWSQRSEDALARLGKIIKSMK